MMKKQKLELNWIGKEHRPRLEPRILIENPSLSYHSAGRREDDLFDNLLINGDNLLALKALEADFRDSVQCIYIDPPFNTQQAFTHYDDAIEHSLWLTLMRDRLQILHTLLRSEGTIWVHLDDVEAHRARCVLDEIFGPHNFVGTVIWEKSDSPRMDAQFFSVRHDYIIVYAKDIERARFNKIAPDGPAIASHYDKVDAQGRAYYLKPLRAMGGQGDSRAARPNLYYALTAPDGSDVYPKRQDGSDGAWRWSRDKATREHDRIDWVQGRNGWTPYYRIYAEPDATRPPETIWPHTEVGSNRTSKAEVKAIDRSAKPFDTPKPEKLLRRILSIASNPGDIVLDSFAGSGTTGAVAHKMKRRWIMVELGEHCVTHVIPRLRKVIDGDDPGGITNLAEWNGGGGYRYLRLAPSLLEKDQFSQWVISKSYNAEMLAEAMCRHMGFTYSPSQDHYWMHGHSSESDFIYVTTASLTYDQLKAISDEVGPERSLLICCKAFQGANTKNLENLSIVKIPGVILDRCEWGKDDYSLKIESLPLIQEDSEEEPEPEPLPRARSKASKAQASLFSTEVEK
jgi:adenine-specific DNA-methyltransferase